MLQSSRHLSSITQRAFHNVFHISTSPSKTVLTAPALKRSVSHLTHSPEKAAPPIDFTPYAFPSRPQSAVLPARVSHPQTTIRPSQSSNPFSPSLLPSANTAAERERMAKESFYMRSLPVSAGLTPYDSSEGKRIFKKALNDGGLESFFPLSQQFLTQEEPAYCGIGTLCMILNALKVDPARTWRSPWRWFTQDMLDCCRPLEYIRKNGITLAEFACLARCNGLDANTKYGNSVTLEQFRQDIIACTADSSMLMAVSYSRAALGQTGSGHFSPVGGYCDIDGGKVLILDVARFKYPSYWVSIQSLYDSLQPLDPSTNQPRGYSMLKKLPHAEDTNSTQLLTLDLNNSSWPTFFQGLVDCAKTVPNDQIMTALTTSLVDTIIKSAHSSPIRTRQETLAPKATAAAEAQNTTANAETDAQRPSTASLAYDKDQSIPSAKEYSVALGGFFNHLASSSTLHALVATLPAMASFPPQYQQLMTVFLLSVYSFEPFLKHLSKAQRETLEALLRTEFSDVEVGREVRGIRQQMAGLETCCHEECGAPKCGGKGRCIP